MLMAKKKKKGKSAESHKAKHEHFEIQNLMSQKWGKYPSPKFTLYKWEIGERGSICVPFSHSFSLHAYCSLVFTSKCAFWGFSHLIDIQVLLGGLGHNQTVLEVFEVTGPDFILYLENQLWKNLEGLRVKT